MDGATERSSAPDGGPLLSVVVPNYNHARYLPTALEALLGQERPADEIIVVDDGSSDGSVALLDSESRRIPSLRVILNETNKGVIAALQQGLEAARGRYVYFGAADDRVLTGFFSLALATLERNPDRGLFCADTAIVNGLTGRPMGRRPAVRPRLRAAVLAPVDVVPLYRRADNFIHTGSAIFRRDFVLAKGGFDARAGSFCDGVLARRIAFTHGFCYAPHQASAWNVFEDGVSRTTALDPVKAKQALTTIPAILAADPAVPPWYPGKFAERWRFGTARLALDAAAPNPEMLMELGSRSTLDRVVLATLRGKIRHPIARTAALAWLSLRLRPYRLRDLVLTRLARLLERTGTTDAAR